MLSKKTIYDNIKKSDITKVQNKLINKYQKEIKQLNNL
jgi:hypothetical protein